jgi:hypothetical protein
VTLSYIALKKKSLGAFFFSFIRGREPFFLKKKDNTLSIGADDTLPVAT